MLMIVPVKDAPDLIKARITIGSLGSTFALSQFNDLVGRSPVAAETYLNGGIPDALGKFINIFLFCCTFANHEKALARRPRALTAGRSALAIPRVTWHQ
jgi:hypothetical protein